MTHPLVRPMEARDVRAVSAVRVRTWQAAYRGIVPQRYLDGLSVDADYRRRWDHFHDPDRTSEVYVAEAGRRVVGFIVIGPARDGDAAGAGEVYALYVLPEHHGTGAGRLLLSRALDRLTGLGYRRVTLWVLEGNAPARRFYEKCGLRPDGCRQLFTGTGRALPEIRYAWSAS